MRSSPSVVPKAGQEIYLVLDDFGGSVGRAWRETAEEDANHEALIRDLMDDQYTRPRRIVAFNTAQGWSRDVTKDWPMSCVAGLQNTMKCPLPLESFSRR
jgi:hypothetical protein